MKKRPGYGPFFKKNITMKFRQSGHLLDTESFDFSLNAA